MRLIDDWRSAHRYWSVRLAAVWAAAMGAIGSIASIFPGAWNALPDDMRGKLPAWLGFIGFALLILSRVIAQRPKDMSKEAGDDRQ